MNDLPSTRQLARDFIASMNRGDRDTLRTLLDAGVVWSVPKSAASPYAGEHHGADTVIGLMLSAVGGAFDAAGVDHDIRLLLADGDWAVVETSMTATHLDGRRYENEYVFLLRVAGGRIVLIREHVDTAYALRFFG